MRYLLVALAVLLGSVTPAKAQVHVSASIGFPAVDIGIHVPVYPRLVQVPGYPVYYDPGAPTNYFFYDGAYWVFHGDGWYVSSWYNGPWQLVAPEYVPVFVLRVPVRYYRHPPPHFRGWRADHPPRWGKYWGRDWERRRAGWDRWDRRNVPRPAPLPVYQRQYSGDRYPRAPEHQHAIRSEQYRYRAREAVTRERFEQPRREKVARPEPRRQGERGRGNEGRGREERRDEGRGREGRGHGHR